jgi:hypothetical protein
VSERWGESFGVCPCGTAFESRYVQATMPSGLRLIDIPQGCCPACASLVYKSGTLLTLESAYRGPPQPQAP